ncbi:MAG: N-glycosylase/DNA lyase [Nanoarchaeota archaeon]|jgi:N-glycosylase/DNA lyase|nr:N-glycosylase/DNA lyase [Nanoarchaeota archaeon]
MRKLVNRVNKLKGTELKNVIDKRMEEFAYFREKGSDEEVFLELCFCFMTANFQAAKSWEIQRELGAKCWTLGKNELQLELKRMGHRFWPQRGSRIFEARWLKDSINSELGKFSNELEMREWIVANLKGLGMKEASHFLRNVGYNDVAIIDKHIINILVDEGLIERPKTLSPKKYIEIERVLRKLGSKVGLSLGELDLYLWSEQTGKVLK